MTPYPAYKASGIEWLGEIPAHWKIVKLKRITQIIYGESLSKDNRTEGNVPVYGSNGITGYHYEAITKNPCIIIGRKGSFGKVNYSEVNCFPIDTTFYIDNSATSNNIRWLYYLLLVLRLDSFSKDSAVPGLNREEIYERDGIIPPLPEQRAISAYLDHKTRLIDAYIAKKQQQIARWQAYRTALINQAVTKGLNPAAPMKESGIEWLGEIPAHWERAKLKYIANFKSGDSITATDINETGHFPVYGGNGIRGYTDRFTHNDNFILIGRQGALCGNIHYTEGCFWASEHAIVVYLQPDYEVFWLGELLRTMNLNQYSLAAAQPGLAVETIRNLIIPIPSKIEQQTIARYIKKQTAKIDTLIVTTQRQLDRLHAYRTALISAAVTGKMDVRNYRDCT